MRCFILTLLVLASPASAQVQWWQKRVVLPADSAVPVAVTEGVPYVGRDAGVGMDVYRPKSVRTPLPAVILVHGGPVTSAIPVEARRLPGFISLGELIASHGVVAVTFSHRLTSVNAVDAATIDVRGAMTYVVSHAAELGIDPSRLCVWANSAGGMLVGPVIREFRDRLRCFVSYYNVLTPRLFQELVARPGDSITPQRTPSLLDLMSRDSLRLPPTFVVRAGQDNPRLNAELDAFVAAALRAATELELHAYAGGHHAFDIFDDTPESRDILLRTMAFLRSHLLTP